jgi:hypothetical protein
MPAARENESTALPPQSWGIVAPVAAGLLRSRPRPGSPGARGVPRHRQGQKWADLAPLLKLTRASASKHLVIFLGNGKTLGELWQRLTNY